MASQVYSSTKLIILDRDGVINYESNHYIKNPDEWIPIPNSLLAIAKLCKAGYTVAIATNQSGIARGYFNEEMLNLIHQKMQNELIKFGGKIDKIFYCPHLPSDNCKCRKPKPELLYQIGAYYQINLTKVAFVGDRNSDVAAAINAGAKPILLGNNGYADLATYVNALLANE